MSTPLSTAEMIDQIPEVPRKHDIHPNHHRFLVMGGGQIGTQILRALCTCPHMAQFIHLVGVWPDWLNNSATRYLRHYSENIVPGAARDPSLVQFANSLPRANSNSGETLQMTGRIVEQLRMFDCAKRYGFEPRQIIKSRYNDELLLALIDKWELDAIMVGAFGGLISQRVRQKVKNKIWTCHPGPYVKDRMDYFPSEGQGKNVLDTLVENQLDIMFLVAMLEIEDKFDSGRIIAQSIETPALFFMDDEMGEENRSERVRKILAAVAPLYGDLVKYNILPLLYKLNTLYPYYKDFPEKLRKMGYTLDAIQRAKRKYENAQVAKPKKKHKK